MDGENKGKPYFLMDDLEGPPLFLETPYIYILHLLLSEANVRMHHFPN